MSLTINETDTSMVLDERAVGVFQDCQRQVEAMAAAWRGDPSVAQTANMTLLRCMVGVFRMGGRIVRDDDLSVTVYGPMTAGMVFHPTHRRVEPPQRHDHVMHRAPFLGRYCLKMLDNNTRYCASPLHESGSPEWRNGRPSCSCDDPHAIVAMPIPGTWSLHS